jgi:ABC-type branched-subunit amino acid transport system substrate-binding protein
MAVMSDRPDRAATRREIMGRFGRCGNVAALLAAVTLVAAACGSSKKSSTSATTGSQSSSTLGAATQASGPGISATTITAGVLADVSGPVPGLFQGGVNGVDAYFQYINSLGGVDGRKLAMKFEDSQLSCAGAQNAATELAPSTFAIVGSWADYDNCEVPVFKANPDLIQVGYPLTNDFRVLPNVFTPRPSPAGFYTGPFIYLHQQYPTATKAASLYSGTPAGEVNWNYQKAALASAGINAVYARGIQPTETDFTADIVRMKNEGVNFILEDDVDVRTIARMLNEAQQQNFRPTVFDAAVGYDNNLLKLTNPGAAEGMLFDEPFSLFLGQDSSTVPEVSLFLQWLKKTHPDSPVDLFAMYSWASAALYVDALKAAGPNLTRASLLTALQGIHSFTDNGMVAQSDPGSGGPPTCWLIGEVKNNNFQRLTPSSGFTCNPDGYLHQ